MSIQTTVQGGIKTTYHHYTLSARYLGNQCAHWSQDNWHNNRITVYNRQTKRRITFDFWGSLMQPELRTRYDLLNAFYCFISDAIAGDQTFQRFCQEFGYSDDSIKAHATWLACRKSLAKAERLINSNLYEFCNALSEIVQ